MALAEAADQQTAQLEEIEEPGADDSDDEVDGPAECSDTDSSSEGSSAEDSGKKSAKRKKKKKKKKAGGGGGDAAATPPIDAAARKEGDRRFQEAVDLLSHNSEDSMWVKLSGCHLADGKMKKLCDALKLNTTLISLDLSANHLTDEGARVLAAALQEGRAPDLIDLDLQDNPGIQGQGVAALEELQQQRKTLRVALGASQPPPPPPPQQQQAAPGKPAAQKGGGGGGAGALHINGSGGSMADTVKSNPVISKYFQVGNDEAEGEEDAQQQQQGGGAGSIVAEHPGGDEEGEAAMGGLSEAELARILWDQLEQCLDAPRPNIPAVSEPLRAIAEQVEHEMDNCALPMLANTELQELRTFTRWALVKLQTMHSVLDLVPAPILTPYSKDKPVPAVGTHRAAVAELLAQLLRAECPVVAQQVAASGVLRRCAAIAVAHPNCSAIHGAVGRCLKLSLSKTVGHVGLWKQLLGSAPAAASAGASSDDTAASFNLAEMAVSIAETTQEQPSVGKRAANVGFALTVSQLLHSAATGEVLGAHRGSGGGEGAAADGAASPSQEQQQQQEAAAGAGDEGPGGGMRRSASAADVTVASAGAVRTPLGREEGDWEAQLAAQLATAKGWSEYSSGEGCLLRQLLSEHEGDLGGPRPRPGMEPEANSDDGDVSSGQIISGQELLMMLRGLNLGGFSGGM